MNDKIYLKDTDGSILVYELIDRITVESLNMRIQQKQGEVATDSQLLANFNKVPTVDKIPKIG